MKANYSHGQKFDSNGHQSKINIDFRYQSIKDDKEKSRDFDQYRFPIDNDLFIDCYRLLLLIIMEKT